MVQVTIHGYKRWAIIRCLMTCHEREGDEFLLAGIWPEDFTKGHDTRGTSETADPGDLYRPPEVGRIRQGYSLNRCSEW